MAKGTKRRRGRSWELRYRYNGRIHTTTVPPSNGRAANAKAVDAALRSFIERVERTVPDAGTVAELADAWLAVAANTVSPTTHAAYTSWVRTTIKPALGRLAVTKVGPDDIDAMYADAGRRLSRRSVRSLHVVTHRMFAQAGPKHWRWLLENPADRASPPPAEAPDIRPPDTADMATLVSAALTRDRALAVYLFLAAVTGARRGELVALQWGDVDWQRSELVIRRNLAQPARGRPVAKAPKSGKPRRIALDPATLTALFSYRDEIRQHGLGRGPWLFTADPAHEVPWRPDGATSRFRRLAKSAGVAGVRLHDIRHYVATTLLADGMDPVTVAGRLGHVNPNITLQVYAAFVRPRDQAAALHMASLLPELKPSATCQSVGVENEPSVVAE